ncbi:MAG: hypothetical protein GXY05_05865 [Clostridiales bacterium]|nr:hypothetical protein [Clostridiales bacterium]
MRTAATTKKKKKSLMPYIITIVIIIIAGTIFTLWRQGIGPFKKAQTGFDTDTITVAFVATASGRGLDAETVAAFREIPVTGEYPIPDDVILLGDDLAGYVLKNDTQANTMLTWSMLTDMNEIVDRTARFVDISYVDQQSYMKEGDYIDIRLKKYSTGGDSRYSDDVIVAKKEVVALNGSTMTLSLSEQELLLIQAAAVEAALVNASRDAELAATLYTTIYVDPANQEAYPVTYINENVLNMLKNNPELAEIYIKGNSEGTSQGTSTGTSHTVTDSTSQGVSEGVSTSAPADDAETGVSQGTSHSLPGGTSQDELSEPSLSPAA